MNNMTRTRQRLCEGEAGWPQEEERRPYRISKDLEEAFSGGVDVPRNDDMEIGEIGVIGDRSVDEIEMISVAFMFGYLRGRKSKEGRGDE